MTLPIASLAGERPAGSKERLARAEIKPEVRFQAPAPVGASRAVLGVGDWCPPNSCCRAWPGGATTIGTPGPGRDPRHHGRTRTRRQLRDGCLRWEQSALHLRVGVWRSVLVLVLRLILRLQQWLVLRLKLGFRFRLILGLWLRLILSRSHTTDGQNAGHCCERLLPNPLHVGHPSKLG